MSEPDEHVRPQGTPPKAPWLAIAAIVLVALIGLALYLRNECVSISDSRYWTPWSGCVNTDD